MEGKRKISVVTALFFMILCVLLTYAIHEERIEEIVVDGWDPITPSLLYPHNITGWAFKALTINGTSLQLNISASGTIRVMVGKLVFDALGNEVWEYVEYEATGEFFDEKINITRNDVDYLEIRNEGISPVEILGCVKKMDKVRVKIYRYQGIGFLMGLLGTSLLIYGIFYAEKKKKPKKY